MEHRAHFADILHHNFHGKNVRRFFTTIDSAISLTLSPQLAANSKVKVARARVAHVRLIGVRSERSDEGDPARYLQYCQSTWPRLARQTLDNLSK